MSISASGSVGGVGGTSSGSGILKAAERLEWLCDERRGAGNENGRWFPRWVRSGKWVVYEWDTEDDGDNAGVGASESRPEKGREDWGVGG